MNLLRVQQQITRPINSSSYSSFPSTRILVIYTTFEKTSISTRYSLEFSSPGNRRGYERRDFDEWPTSFFEKRREERTIVVTTCTPIPKKGAFSGVRYPDLQYIYTYTKRVTSHCQPTLARDARTHTRRGARSHGREPFERQGALPYDL